MAQQLLKRGAKRKERKKREKERKKKANERICVSLCFVNRCGMVVAGAKVAAIRVNTSTQAFHGDGKTNALRVCLAGRKKPPQQNTGFLEKLPQGRFRPCYFIRFTNSQALLGEMMELLMHFRRGTQLNPLLPELGTCVLIIACQSVSTRCTEKHRVNAS